MRTEKTASKKLKTIVVLSAITICSSIAISNVKSSAGAFLSRPSTTTTSSSSGSKSFLTRFKSSIVKLGNSVELNAKGLWGDLGKSLSNTKSSLSSGLSKIKNLFTGSSKSTSDPVKKGPVEINVRDFKSDLRRDIENAKENASTLEVNVRDLKSDFRRDIENAEENARVLGVNVRGLKEDLKRDLENVKFNVNSGIRDLKNIITRSKNKHNVNDKGNDKGNDKTGLDNPGFSGLAEELRNARVNSSVIPTQDDVNNEPPVNKPSFSSFGKSDDNGGSNNGVSNNDVPPYNPFAVSDEVLKMMGGTGSSTTGSGSNNSGSPVKKHPAKGFDKFYDGSFDDQRQRFIYTGGGSEDKRPVYSTVIRDPKGNKVTAHYRFGDRPGDGQQPRDRRPIVVTNNGNTSSDYMDLVDLD